MTQATSCMLRGSFSLRSAKIHSSAHPNSKFLVTFAVLVFRMCPGSVSAFTVQVLVLPGMFTLALGCEEASVLGERQVVNAERVASVQCCDEIRRS